MPDNMKKAYIVLILKKKGSKLPQVIRFITLINPAYKLLDKLTAARLKADIQAKRISMKHRQVSLIRDLALEDIYTKYYHRLPELTRETHLLYISSPGESLRFRR